MEEEAIDVRCPRPGGRRWRRGEDGPCGLKLGELRRGPDGEPRVYTLALFMDLGDGRFQLLGKPTKGSGAAVRAKSGTDSIAVPPGGDLWLVCPQCGAETHLSKLTTS